MKIILAKRFLTALLLMVVFIPFSGSIDARTNKAPGIALEDMNGDFTLLGSLLKKNNLLLSFWSYDCVPCRKEMPELFEMSKQALFKEKKMKLVFIYVEATTAKSTAASKSKKPIDKAREVLKEMGIDSICLLDIYGVAFKNYRKARGYKKATLPMNCIVNQKRKILFSAIGYKEKNIKKMKRVIKRKIK